MTRSLKHQKCQKVLECKFSRIIFKIVFLNMFLWNLHNNSFQTELNVKLHLLEINSCLFYFDVFEETMTHSDHLSINLNGKFPSSLIFFNAFNSS